MRFAIPLICAAMLFFFPAGPAAGAGVCDGQPPIADKEIRDALEVIGEFLRMGGDLSPGDEETLIRGRGLTSERLNCVLGKVMAGNDIFGWGSTSAYGLSLSPEETKLVKKYINESQGLKEYLEQSLNIQVESD